MVLCHHTQLRILNLNSSMLKFIENFLSFAVTLCLARFFPQFYHQDHGQIFLHLFLYKPIYIFQNIKISSLDEVNLLNIHIILSFCYYQMYKYSEYFRQIVTLNLSQTFLQVSSPHICCLSPLLLGTSCGSLKISHSKTII